MKPATRASLLAGAAAVGTGGAAAYAMFSPRSQLLGRVLIAPRIPGEVALTFDDGPNPDATPRLLDVLARHNVRATFFLIGKNVRREPALARRIAAEGHVIGNHTMTHPWLPLLPRHRIEVELQDCAHAIEDTLGAPAKLFRPPHGARTLAVLRAASELGMTTVNWNVMVGDWKPQTAQVLGARISRGIGANDRSGDAANVVLHDGGHGAPRKPTVDAVAMLLESLHGRQQYRFTTPDAWIE